MAQRRSAGILMARSLTLLLLAAFLHGCTMSGSRVSMSVPSQESVLSRLEAGGIVRGAKHQLTKPDLDRIYDAAIYDSAIYRTGRQAANLRAVTGPAKMGSFISCYQCDECQSCKVQNCPNGDCAAGVCSMCGTCSSKCVSPGVQPAPSDIWVSFTDQVLEFCSQLPADDVVIGMQQLQGLPPNLDQPSVSWKFLLVDIEGPHQLFRPCANADPTSSGPCDATFGSDAPKELEAWIAGQALSSWQVPDGYPWTRQGYTYNWNPNADSIVGTSEFVVPSGTVVNVTGLVDAAGYCTDSTQ